MKGQLCYLMSIIYDKVEVQHHKIYYLANVLKENAIPYILSYRFNFSLANQKLINRLKFCLDSQYESSDFSLAM